MPPHHHKRYADMWWEDMPEKAHQAAKVMGYDEKTWDDDAQIDYDRKPFHETTLEQRRAAMYLGLNPIDKKLNIWWKDADDKTKEQAKIIGWDETTWDEDWSIREFPIEHMYWKDLDEKQKQAATYFGYSRSTWDESEEEDDLDFSSSVKPTEGGASHHDSGKHDEKKEEDEHHYTPSHANVEEAQHSSKPTSSAASSGAAAAKQKSYLKSKKFGGDGGGSFDHGNFEHIAKISIKHDGHAVHQISGTYSGGRKIANGADKGDLVELNFQQGEYVNKITVRHHRLIQSLTFETNRGRTLGPAGGQGWKLLGKDKKGEEEEIFAPEGYKLCGFSGAAGDYLDSIIFHWGSI